MLISIITINYNNKNGLEKTMQSVFNQSYDGIEYLVIDGNSMDGSIDLINSHKDRIATIIVEPDKGPYDAMNKGKDRAKGEYLLFLNSGDYLASKTVIEQFIALQPEEDIVYGDSYFNIHNKLKRKRMPESLSIGVGLTHTINHQAMFFKNTLFEDGSRYDISYNIVADWVFTNEALLNKDCTTRHLDLVISVYDTTGISSDPSLRKKEREKYVNTFDDKFKKLHKDYVMLNARYQLLKNNFIVKLLLILRSNLKKFFR